MIKFNIASINRCTEVEGPYKRLCIWFQGCNIHCKNCCNPDYQPLEIKNLVDIEELLAIISEAKKEFDIEGVTYSGGEPTLQQGLFELTARIHALGLGVISFTGNAYENVKNTMSNCDMVLDGPFDFNIIEDKRKLLGSKNQRIICLTDRYKDALEWFILKNRTTEVNIAESIIINGDKI